MCLLSKYTNWHYWRWSSIAGIIPKSWTNLDWKFYTKADDYSLYGQDCHLEKLQWPKELFEESCESSLGYKIMEEKSIMALEIRDGWAHILMIISKNNMSLMSDNCTRSCGQSGLVHMFGMVPINPLCQWSSVSWLSLTWGQECMENLSITW